VKEVIFQKGGFPSKNLINIGRPTVAGGRESATTLMLRYSTILLSLIMLLAEGPVKRTIKVSKRKTVKWELANPQRGFTEVVDCVFCTIIHPARVECPYETMVKEGGWERVEEAIQEGEGVTEIDWALYVVEMGYN
jgi:hypothetical protein